MSNAEKVCNVHRNAWVVTRHDRNHVCPVVQKHTNVQTSTAVTCCDQKEPRAFQAGRPQASGPRPLHGLDTLQHRIRLGFMKGT